MVKEKNPLQYRFMEIIKDHYDNKVPIRRGCPNAGLGASSGCFCSGACQEIIGWRDKTEEEKRPFSGFQKSLFPSQESEVCAHDRFNQNLVKSGRAKNLIEAARTPRMLLCTCKRCRPFYF